MKDVLFFDLETDSHEKIRDIGAWLNRSHFHDTSIEEFELFAQRARFICGHNILAHDLPILQNYNLREDFSRKPLIDTLYLSALLFPNNPYHKLVKDYKLISEEINNPVSDSRLARQLLMDCLKKYERLDVTVKKLFTQLLEPLPQFNGFFKLLKENDEEKSTEGEPHPDDKAIEEIKERFREKVCISGDYQSLTKDHPLELAYALALLDSETHDSVFPPWLQHHHPQILQVLHKLRYNRCSNPQCAYCNSQLDAKAALKRVFGFNDFRRFEGDGFVPLQEQVVNAALDNKSFLAIFPTGGGKSLTFQLPALLKGEACRRLTVVISPLQSLMKDQVDNLKERHDRIDAVTINGLLSPLERAEAIRRVESGAASVLYISPESLRSATIMRLLINRHIDRFVIDEAHCFSAWGQDFRVDYLYIGEFLNQLAKEKRQQDSIPVSCFTATAKPSVVKDIRDYFRKKSSLELEVFQTAPARKNLSYGMYYAESAGEKFSLLLNLLAQDEAPKIIYTTRVKRSETLAERLIQNGFKAAAYNGRMNSDEKIKIQDDFMTGKVNVIVATSAFGMGIDKDDVSMVIHYNISDSLENYMQEAGRAGRNKDVKANCYVLFDDNDLMGHFNLLNISRINKKEIYQIWQGIKKLKKEKFSRSARELAQLAGWDTELANLEMRVKTALAALEEAGLIKRGLNQTRVFATALGVKNMEDASLRIQNYEKFDEQDRLQALRIIKHIISYKDCPVDSIAEILGLPLVETRRLLNELKGLGIIGDDRDMTAFVNVSGNQGNYAPRVTANFSRLETAMLEAMRGVEKGAEKRIVLKTINSLLREANVPGDIDSLRTVLFTWESQRWISKQRLDRQNHIYLVRLKISFDELQNLVRDRRELAGRVLEKLLINAEGKQGPGGGEEKPVEFSIGELKKYVQSQQLFKKSYSVAEIDRALLYLNEISAVKLDRGLFVYYTPFSITCCNNNSRRQYTNKDYKKFEAFYRHKIEQVHIVGEYAKKLSENYKAAISFVEDYFKLDYAAFLKKYFPRRLGRIQRPITEKQFKKLFDHLSTDQLKIIEDNRSKAILVAAGPGSGKTRVLVHKVASLLLLEDVRTEQFLMLTYSRAAAMEMKARLRELVKEKANYVDIYTFHSFAFAISEIRGDLEHAGEIIPRAVELINAGQAVRKVENKSVLVIDEFQDIGGDEFALIRAIVDAAKEIRVLAVGDDDQNIFQFRGSSTQYMKFFTDTFKAAVYPLNTNYRSKENLVRFADFFIRRLPDRIKEGQVLVSSQPGENGTIGVVKYNSSPLVTPLTDDVMRRCRGDREGTSAVLTATNEEALQVYFLLRQRGVPAQLLLSYPDFSLKAMVELKMFSHFLRELTHRGDDKIISREDWQEVRKKLVFRFDRSKQLETALKVIDTFESRCHNLLEVDWQDYLNEVRVEDFIFPESGQVFVSTMHKAKGKEFDRVFLLLDRNKVVSDENIRVIYVAVTRAKEQLFIHTGLDIFDEIMVPGQSSFLDNGIYTPPEQFVYQCTMRDIFLDFATKEIVVDWVKMLQAGDSLSVSHDNPRILTSDNMEVCMFSAAAFDRLKGFFDRGYRIKSIRAEYIVVWKRKEDNKYYRILLPRVELTSPLF